MKKRMTFFDAVTLFATVSMLFSIGWHIGKPRKNDVEVSAEITVTLVKAKYNESDKELLIDGKYGCDVIYLSDGEMIICCSGKYREAGFLTSGAKYLSNNQPIEIKGESSYFYGRISKIDFKKSIRD
ncbi:MAG: hypothetical protein E7673_00580 [Ruminococcaceae bacterium]|nr:hypothetical protein [Oscillospiraceae bacterium]